MDEMNMLTDSFDPGVPSAAAEQRARTALQTRMSPAPLSPAPLSPAPLSPAPRRRRRAPLRLPIAFGSAAMAAAVVAAFAISHTGGGAPGTPSTPAGPPAVAASLPYLRPASASQVFQNAAWTVEQQPWTDPAPQQFMYIETRELRNPPAYEKAHPNDALVPGQAQYRTIQRWQRIDGKVMATIRNGKLVVDKQDQVGSSFDALDWATIAGLTTPEKVGYWVAHPGNISMDIDSLAGQYVLPPAVKAALFRYLAQQPGMKINPDAVNIDGHPAIGLGRVEEGYLSQELLFDKQTYALVGERLVVSADHDDRASGGTVVAHKGDLLRQVVYRKMTVVDQAGQTGE